MNTTFTRQYIIKSLTTSYQTIELILSSELKYIDFIIKSKNRVILTFRTGLFYIGLAMLYSQPLQQKAKQFSLFSVWDYPLIDISKITPNYAQPLVCCLLTHIFAIQ